MSLNPTSNWLLCEHKANETSLILPDVVSSIQKHVYVRAVGPDISLAGDLQPGDEIIIAHGAKIMPVPELWEDEKWDNHFFVRASDVIAWRNNDA